MRWDDTNLPELWEKFMRHTALMFSGPLKAKTEEEKVSYLLLWVGDKGRDIRHTWTDISADDAKKLDTFYERFKKHVRPTLNPIFARYQFNNEMQGSEAIDSFVTRLRLKSRDCDYHDPEEMIRDRIVFGTYSPKIREKLINVGRDLTLQKAIQIGQMDAPKDRSELETILGMVTYLTRFAPNLATLTAPLRNLLKKDVEFVWNNSHDEAFQKIKDVLTDIPVLAYFNPKLDVTLQVDASKYGLGATLLQEGRPVSYASKTLTQTEIGYAQIEKEMLGILFGAKRFHEYIYGRRVTVESDAKPLSSIAKKPLSSAPLRLQRILLQLQRYDLDIKHVSGRDIPLADTLSRKFLPDTYPELSEGLDLHVHTVFSTISVSDRKLEQVRQATRNDVQFQTLKRTILDGWPETRKMCPPSILEYWNHRDELSVADDIIIRAQKIVIPTSLRLDMTQAVHESHMGVEKSLQRAKDIMFWPRMTSDITNFVLKCDICHQYRASNTKQPLQSHQIPDRPWQVAGTDVFTFDNKDYLVTLDYFSRYFEVDLLPTTTSISIIRKLKTIFARHGIVEKLVCDNASYYTSEAFNSFAQEWNFRVVHSSPRFPQSNGLSEKTVSIVKRIFSLGTRCPVYFKTINAVKLHISTLCQICFQNKQPRYNL